MNNNRILEFLTLDTAHRQDIPLSFVKATMLRMLRDIVAKGWGSIHRFHVIVTMQNGFALFSTHFGDVPLALGNTCWEEAASAEAFGRAMDTWAMSHSAIGLGNNAPRTRQPSRTPWAAVNLMHLPIHREMERGSLTPLDLTALGTLHSCLAWAIVMEGEACFKIAQST
jgi:hypothetical protein